MKGPSKAAFQFLICIKAKYILQKSTTKINQSIIQLAIRQFFQKLKNKTTKNRTLVVCMQHETHMANIDSQNAHGHQIKEEVVIIVLGFFVMETTYSI
jgi:hypothetical protein